MGNKVVHCKRDPYDVYIGRGGPFGNPFIIGRDGNRDEVIAKFRQYAEERMVTDDMFALQVKTLRDKVLGCWCAPQACHGDVLVELSAKD